MAEHSEASTSSTSTSTSTSMISQTPSNNDDRLKGPDVSGQQVTSSIGMQMFPTVCPALIPNFATNELQDHPIRGAGLYAVHVHPFAGSFTGPVPNYLIPLNYSVPTSSGSGATGQGNEPGGQQGARPQLQGGADEQVVIRQFQIAINLNLPLLLKLVAVIYLFHRDGSRQRLALLVFVASIIYMYQTGALKPLTRWLRRPLNRVPQRLRPRRDALLPNNVNPGNRNPALEERGRGLEDENHNQADGDGNLAGVNNGPAEEQAIDEVDANPLWALMKEIQIFVIGFITSILPGFQHLD